ncbi:type III secretion protein HrpO [Bradyrhizobium macuxiense]|uniref:Type III secretion protein HrpO n=1 Tax=Bradyrhizobium macuxiense TaxID=1755647 RepID=A0A109K063_9BRAD|nr:MULTISPECIES: type III secretion system export apparatus subunit SctS [Bradyrhizobium]KWV58261.1 type III secretion protein HrpO [Bradyrhizobium macuxiense]
MNSATLVNVAVEALTLSVVLSLPAVLVATIVGLTISLIQAMTQIQEQTLSFAVKLISVNLVLVATASWFEELGRYTMRIFDKIGAV